MEVDNLISFNSPCLSDNKDRSVCNLPCDNTNVDEENSPGNNPFDDILKSVETERLSIQFHSPFKRPAILNHEQSSNCISPFNDILKKTREPIIANKLDADSPTIFKVPSSIPFKPESPFKLRLSAEFDIGRESIPPNLNDISCCDSGRPSFKFNHSLNEFGRESLGILNLSARESLGILHINSPDLNYGLTTDISKPEIILSVIRESKGLSTSNITALDAANNTSTLNFLNNGFLAPPGVKPSFSSISSCNSLNPSFNSRSLEISDPSRISSVHLSESNRCISSIKSSDSDRPTRADLFNNAFETTSGYLRLNLPSTSVSAQETSCINQLNLSRELLDFRSRIQSLPAPKNIEKKAEDDSEDGSDSRANRRFWSAERVKRKVIVSRSSFSGALTFDEEDDSNFNDSVFIEAHHLASKIANCSVNSNCSGESDNLDSTSPPDLCDNDELEPQEDQDKEPAIPNIKTIFKTVDKMLPPSINSSSDLRPTVMSKDSADNLENPKSDAENHRNVSSMCEPSKSKGTEEILHNLSAIINSSNKSDSQKAEGQHLLSNLAAILCKQTNELYKKTSESDDSNHPSIDESNNKESEGLRKASLSQDNPTALDVSMKAKVVDPKNKRLSQSFNFPSPKTLSQKLSDSLRKNSGSTLDSTRNSRLSTASSNESKSSFSQNFGRAGVSKFKLKRQEDKGIGSKKGPLKATIPIGDIAKRRNKSPPIEKTNRSRSFEEREHEAHTTPKKPENRIPLTYGGKRTSTPITEPMMRPVAQSTPEGPSNTAEKQTVPTSEQKQPTTPLSRAGSLRLRSTGGKPSFIFKKTASTSKLPKTGELQVNVMKELQRQSSTSSVSSLPENKSGSLINVTKDNQAKPRGELQRQSSASSTSSLPDNKSGSLVDIKKGSQAKLRNGISRQSSISSSVSSLPNSRGGSVSDDRRVSSQVRRTNSTGKDIEHKVGEKLSQLRRVNSMGRNSAVVRPPNSMAKDIAVKSTDSRRVTSVGSKDAALKLGDSKIANGSSKDSAVKRASSVNKDAGVRLEENGSKLKRTSSVGKGNRLSSAISKIKDNLAKSSYLKSSVVSSTESLEEKDGGKMRVASLRENIRPLKTNFLGRLKKPGKENANF